MNAVNVYISMYEFAIQFICNGGCDTASSKEIGHYHTFVAA